MKGRQILILWAPLPLAPIFVVPSGIDLEFYLVWSIN